MSLEIVVPCQSFDLKANQGDGHSKQRLGNVRQSAWAWLGESDYPDVVNSYGWVKNGVGDFRVVGFAKYAHESVHRPASPMRDDLLSH